MSFLARPSVVFAIIFGCFAVLVPRVFLPLFRSKSNPVQNPLEDRFRRPPPPPPPVQRHEHGDNIEYIPGSPPHMRGPHPGMRMHHQTRPAGGSTESTSSKSIVTLALPMYTVGIGVFFVYTCCKYWSKKNDDNQVNNRNVKRKDKINLDLLDQDSEEEIAEKSDLYAGVDADYLEYLKMKKQKALEAQAVMTDEQKQMHSALEEMKKSLSYISSKLITKESRGNLKTDEIYRLQERLAATESQMCQILSALDKASSKVNQTTTDSDQVPVEDAEKCEEEQKPTENKVEHDENESSDESEQTNSFERSRSASSSSDQSIQEEEEQEDQSIPNSQSNNLIHRKRH